MPFKSHGSTTCIPSVKRLLSRAVKNECVKETLGLGGIRRHAPHLRRRDRVRAVVDGAVGAVLRLLLRLAGGDYGLLGYWVIGLLGYASRLVIQTLYESYRVFDRRLVFCDCRTVS